MVLKRMPIGHATRSADDDVILVVDRSAERILNYQKTKTCSKLKLPTVTKTFVYPFLKTHTEAGFVFQDLYRGKRRDVEIRYDLVDTQISVCSPQVLTLFTDNFDYLSRDHFVKGILVNEEV